jgi:glycine/D-amino acid oxidase-like deaminating enzyme
MLPPISKSSPFISTQFKPMWFDTVEPYAIPTTPISASYDLLIVGAGFTGLWTGILAQSRYPSLKIAILDANSVGFGGSGRNGGFLHASLTHGALNGIARWPEEFHELHKLGVENLREIREFVFQNQIECDWRDAGEVEVAVQNYQLEAMNETIKITRAYGEDLLLLDEEEIRNRLNSPLFKGGLFEEKTVAMVNPSQLAQGLAKYLIQKGVEIHENTSVVRIKKSNSQLLIKTTDGRQVTAKHVALATNAFRSPVAAVRRRIVPVYDYQIATRKLTADEWHRIGWNGYEGFRDAGNQFHYFRRTADGRIIFGGYDAVYHFKNRMGASVEHNQVIYEKLSQHFYEFFPQLNVTFDYAWGGAIDTCSRFTAFWGTKYNRRLAYVAGYTGLGVGASRFGANVMLDLLFEKDSPRLKLKMVKTKPIPFPPEPIRWLVIKLTQLSIQQADRNQSRRNLWLRLLDKLGLGFDS